MNILKHFLPVMMVFWLMPAVDLKAQLPKQEEDEYSVEWLKIEALVEKGLPQSALEELDLLQPLALQRNHHDQYIKCILYRIKLQADFEESSLENNIYLVEQEITNSKTPVKQILHSILARLYWNYYINNRYQLMDRLPDLKFDPNDIQTWDLNRLVSTTIFHFNQSLRDSRTLKSIDLKKYDALLETALNSKQYRPTLYDFLAHEAIDFFMNEETYLTRPAEPFLLDKEAYFADAQTFSQIKLTSTDSLSLKLYAFRLLQDILAFHLRDTDPTALIDADLKRLLHVHSHSVLNNRDSLYKKSLGKLISTYSAFPSVTDVYYQLAMVHYTAGSKQTDKRIQQKEQEYRKADSICTLGMKDFPETEGALKCKGIQQSIRAKSLSMKAEYGNLPGKPVLFSISYRNVNEIVGRIVKIDPEQHRLNMMKMDTKALLDYFMAEPVFKTFRYTLPDESDLNTHTTELAMPALEPGFYVVVLASSGQFHVLNDAFTWTPFWISRISFISKTADDGSLEYFVLDRETGQPFKNVKVNSYVYEYEYASRTRISKLWNSYTTDKNGYFSIPGPSDRKESKSLMFRFEAKNDQYSTENPVYLSFQGKDYQKPTTRTHLFTDRAIYRPGQTVWFKGISFEGMNNAFTLLKEKPTSVYLYDVNGQLLDTKNLKTNEFGSFSGSFILPVGKLNGSMRIACDYGVQPIQVEEYKRPRFEVVYDAVKEAFKLGEKVNITARALSFAGAPLDNANVSYRISRQPAYPYWFDFKYFRPMIRQTEMANGTGKTNEKGEFIITFPALPDPEVAADYDPVYTYIVHTEVVDINGESHSKDMQVSAGSKAMLISTDLPKKIQKQELKQFRILTTNLDGSPLKAKGTFSIHKLQMPKSLLKERLWDQPDRFVLNAVEFRKQFPNHIYDREDDTLSWAKEQLKLNKSFDNAVDTIIPIPDAGRWEPGVYSLRIESADIFGTPVSFAYYFTLADYAASKPGNTSYLSHNLMNKLTEPGSEAELIIGTSAKKAHILLEISKDNKMISRQWLDLSNAQKEIRIPVREEHRGNIDYCITCVKDNRNFLETGIIQVPFSNRELSVHFTRFRDKLEPGGKERIEFTVKGPKSEQIQAEAVFGMYDASLETFIPHNWDFSLYRSSRIYTPWQKPWIFQLSGSYTMTPQGLGGPSVWPGVLYNREYDRLNWFGYSNSEFAGGALYYRDGIEMDMGNVKSVKQMKTKGTPSYDDAGSWGDLPGKPVQAPASPGLASFKARSAFQETAFFYPELRSNEKGEIVFSYTIPDALTRWNMFGLVHTQNLEYALVKKEVQTLKDLMVFPNLPRFLREGDTVRISIKINNQSEEMAEGQALLQIFNPLDISELSSQIITSALRVPFRCAAKQSSVAEWTIIVPANISALSFRTSATAGYFTDMEENLIPVLSSRTLVTESMPMPSTGPGSKSFTFKTLLQNKSKTLRHHRLSLEYTANPVWYAIQALPSLMDFDAECSESVFNSLYANSIAEIVQSSSPDIKKVFDAWRTLSPSALLSALEKNPELKELALLETPWVNDAANETESKQRVGELFEPNHLQQAQAMAIQKLSMLQSPNGGWPWYAGLPDSRYITNYIMCGIGKMNKMGVSRLTSDQDALISLAKAITYLDQRAVEEYASYFDKEKHLIAGKNISTDQIQYLYTRSFYIDLYDMEDTTRAALDYFINQQSLHWNSFNPYLQAMIAISMNRFGNEAVAKNIVASLRQKALHSAELGMYWRDLTRTPHWSTAPVQAQALLIELFREVANDDKAVDELKVWLLKNKQTSKWESSIATADACYALLMRGSDWLNQSSLPEFTISGQPFDPKAAVDTKTEAGSGYFITSWTATEIRPEMGNITVTKSTAGPSWGAMYWQYFEDISKVSSQQGPLSVKKKFYIRRNTPSGPVLDLISAGNPVKTGDRVVVRLEIRTDRDLEFVHLKDPRAAGLEPEESLSGFRYQQRLAYYQAIRDASTDFFFTSLNKGTYVFDYTLIANIRGEFSSGPAHIQCYYAPEFNSNSDGRRLKIE